MHTMDGSFVKGQFMEDNTRVGRGGEQAGWDNGIGDYIASSWIRINPCRCLIFASDMSILRTCRCFLRIYYVHDRIEQRFWHLGEAYNRNLCSFWIYTYIYIKMTSGRYEKYIRVYKVSIFWKTCYGYIFYIVNWINNKINLIIFFLITHFVIQNWWRFFF